MTEPTPPRGTKRRSLGSWLIMWVVGLLVAFIIYVASVGPVAVLVFRTHSSKLLTTAEWVYWPLECLTGHDTLAYRWISGYVQWWLHVTNTNIP